MKRQFDRKKTLLYIFDNVDMIFLAGGGSLAYFGVTFDDAKYRTA